MDRNKVIDDLAHCRHGDCYICGAGPKCKYIDHTVKGGLALMPIQLIRKVFALLKEQEPRVLTADEMTELGKTGGAVWVEESPEGSDPKCFWGLVTEGVEPPKDKGYNYPGGVYFNVVDTESDMWDGDFYGLKTPLGWRAWTARPTEEQRKAVKWK